MMNRTILKLLASVILIAISPLASATPWTINSVLSGTDGSFGYSSFHDASGGNPMSGSSFGSISSVAAEPMMMYLERSRVASRSAVIHLPRQVT
jgi:hypothetical protein